MVGFGSSLRMARRPGWEEAYFDYETLKLLLTQIEAVYEEEAHLQQQRQHQQQGDQFRDLDVMFLETPENGRYGGRRQRGMANKTEQLQSSQAADKQARDYRDELFLESDSDAAFESLMKYDYYSAAEDASDLEHQKQQLEIEQRLATMQSYAAVQQSPCVAGSVFSERDHNHQHHNHGQQQHRSDMTTASNTSSGLPFSFASSYYSQDYTATEGYEDVDEDDDDDSQDEDTNCVPSFGRLKKVKKAKSNNNKQKNKRPNFRSGKSARGGSQFLSPTGESEYFVTANSKGADAFILDEVNPTGDDEINNNNNSNNNQLGMDVMSTLTSFGQTQQQRQVADSNSILQKPFRRTTGTETTSPAGGSSLFSFASQTGPVTPPTADAYRYSNAGSRPASRALQMPTISNATQPSAATTAHLSNKTQLLKQLEEERKAERRIRRQKKRQRAEQRKALERKVPRHIRQAHTKAREITERFLGLLRAECEKVMLFAQSKLGELADTAGSLRFPGMEDHHHHHHPASSSSHHHHPANHDSGNYESAPLSPTGSAAAAASRGTVGSYDYPLSDGGMHPSASSSSDDGVGGSGLFYWSDSSSDSVKSHNSGGSPHVPRGLSAFRDMQEGRHSHHHQASGENGNGNKHHRVPSSTRKKHDGFDSAKRHLDHFEKIRRNRPMFQRNGNIMGEDLLLLSAVDEADGYTAVGVELMHVLRFVSVNLIAVRKICRKHDRLLMNRMLGGYYHHLKILAAAESSSKWNAKEKKDHAAKTNKQKSKQDEHVQNAQTLGGLLARESGDIFETHHPAVIGQVNNYKLVGLYDANLQQLANSRTVQVISSCLVLALSEYEVSRSRANALATLNTTGTGIPAPRRGSGAQAVFRHKQQQDQMSIVTGTDPHTAALMEPLNEHDEYDSDGEGGPVSTASSISLTRLRFTVTSIIALREAARKKKDMYSTYLSRSMLAFTGRGVCGEGLDGCSRETLAFFVSYNPDAALLMDPSSLNDGLKRGMWSKRAISSVMASSLAVATTPVDVPYTSSAKDLDQQERMVKRAVNLLPKVKFVEVPELFKGQRAKKSITGLAIMESDCFRSILRINRASHLLFTMNYFIVHPTTITFVRAIGSPGAHSALVIGAPSVAALLSALLHCYVLSGDSKAPLANLSSLRWLFLLAALLGVAGNAVHAYGVWEDSISVAIFGRFIMGFSCSEILHRNVVAGFLPVHRVVTETAILVQMQVLGMLLGFAVGTLAEFLPYHIIGWGIRSLSSSSWLMGLLWFTHLVHVCICFNVKDGEAMQRLEDNNAAEVEQLLTRYKPSRLAHGDSDSSGSEHGNNNDSSHRLRTSLHLTYGATDDTRPEQREEGVEQPAANPPKKKKGRIGKSRKRRMRTLKSYPSRLRSLMNYSVAVPVCLFIILYIKFALEVLVSSCPMILNRYFRWGGGRAGIFLSALTLTILPMNFICGHVARKYEERTVMKKSLVVLGIGLVAMINYGSFAQLAFQIRDLMNETEDRQRETKYDWLLGIVQYFVGFTVTFLSLTSLDSATLSLLSKVAPPRIRSSSVALQLGTIVSFVSLIARIIADFQILMIGLSHRLINTDLVNSLVLPLLVACVVIAQFVRKHFFFLM